MLKSLYIRNYALIDTLDIRLGKGFSVITGETGAGKSIILGAIGLLLGQRADTKAIKSGASRCTIEARFDITDYHLKEFFGKHELEYEKECILRRELQANGKSRAFINDTPAPLSVMKELGEKLIDVHSQHQNLLLNNESYQLGIVDILAQNGKELSEYQKLFRQYKETAKELERITELAEKSKADEDYIRFQLSQLEEAQLKEAEQEELEAEAAMLGHAEEIKAGLYSVDQSFFSDAPGILARLKESLHILQTLQKVYQPANELAERLESNYIDLKDIAQEISNAQESVEFNPERLEFVNARLNLIYSLEQKHRVHTPEELIALMEEYHGKLQVLTSFEEQINMLNKEKEQLYNKVIKQAEVLASNRKKAALEIEKEMQTRLIPLGMPNVRFVVELTSCKDPGPYGTDNVSLLFSANKNSTLQPISNVASGGEIARVMLSLKAMIAGTVQLPSIIFDEIDTGVSGEIADKMASIMEEMATCMQVISITHLPQIAARGAMHYKVYKQDNDTGTNSNIRLLGEEERVDEIAHMLSGAILTQAAVNNAKELLAYSAHK